MNPRRLVPSLVLIFASAAFATQIPSESFSALHWRSIGPLRAGWVTATDGIPGIDTFFMGTADGGVWRTDDIRIGLGHLARALHRDVFRAHDGRL